MTKEEASEWQDIIAALIAGEPIQCRQKDGDPLWLDTENPTFTAQYEYRVRRADPKPLWVLLNVDGVVSYQCGNLENLRKIKRDYPHLRLYSCAMTEME